MHSLRARLLTGVLLLAALALVVVGAVTYAEQRSFLEQRVDEQTKAAVPALSQLLDSLGYRPPSSTGEPAGHARGPGGARGRGGAGGPGPQGGLVNLPPGTYGERRLASGRVLGAPVRIKYSSSESIPAAPALPAQLPVRHLVTVGSSTGHGPSYRVYMAPDPEDSGFTVAAVPLLDVDQTLRRLLLVEGLVIGGVLILLGLTAFFVVRLGLRPLSRMEVTAGAIAEGDLSRRVSPADRRTEVGRLGLALNKMLDRLEQAFSEREASESRLRQFVADASHELRTPLASIRGYAELFRMGATDGADTQVAMQRIEDESKRMGVLVEDLLTLARLDEQPTPRRGAVDVAEMARNVAKDARATDPDRRIDVVAPATAVVTGDSDQLHQVLANLVRNALVHTPPRTPIEFAVEPGEGVVAVRVRDHGPGLPAGSEQQLFDRFWRASAGRERGSGGAGLGLAIASEIVAAHGGRIEAANAPDGGAIFTVTLAARAHAATAGRS